MLTNVHSISAIGWKAVYGQIEHVQIKKKIKKQKLEYFFFNKWP